MDTPLAARCLRGLGLAYNGCGDAEGALEPLQAARTVCKVSFGEFDRCRLTVTISFWG